MNNFCFNGVVRDNPEKLTISGKEYIAFVLSQSDDHTLVPFFATGKVADKLMRIARIGNSIEVQGKFVSELKYYEDKAFIRLYLVVEKASKINSPRIEFTENVVLEKLLSLYDTEDLLKEFRKKGKKDDK